MTGKISNIIKGGLLFPAMNPPPSPVQVLPAAWVEWVNISSAGPSGSQSEDSVSQKSQALSASQLGGNHSGGRPESGSLFLMVDGDINSQESLRRTIIRV